MLPSFKMPLVNLPYLTAGVALKPTVSRYVPTEKATLAPHSSDSVELTASAAKAPPRRGFLKSLLGMGKALGMACLNGVAGLGLLLLGPRVSEPQEREFARGEATLQADSGFAQRVATSAFDGLLELMRRPDLPGETARERLDFVMWYTDSNRGQKLSAWEKLTQICTHFHPESPFVTHANDRGFAADVADSVKWYNPQATGFVADRHHGRIDQGSPQVGHFLTAVDIGRQGRLLSGLLSPAAIGHELVGDDQGAFKQVLIGYTHGRERALFAEAIASAAAGDRVRAHQVVEQALPDLSVSGDEPGRVGNSKQDLLNTSYGMAFGRLIRDGQLKTRQAAADWLHQNVGRGAPSLAWNEPS